MYDMGRASGMYGGKENGCWVSAGKPQQTKPLEDLGIDSRIWLGRCRLD